jgi:hypothetical protein
MEELMPVPSGNKPVGRSPREGKLPFPVGANVGQIAWAYVSSEENNKTFGRDQSFVAGSPTDFYLHFMVKDSRNYSATGVCGTLPSIRTANLPTRRLCKAASSDTSSSKLAIMSLPDLLPSTENRNY